MKKRLFLLVSFFAFVFSMFSRFIVRNNKSIVDKTIKPLSLNNSSDLLDDFGNDSERLLERSGLDPSKYLSLPLDEQGILKLPEAANYSGGLGNSLLRYIKPGDIMFDPVGMGDNNLGSGHVALIEGIFYCYTFDQLYIRTIESNPSTGVKQGYMDVSRFTDVKSILRVTSNKMLIDDVLFFARSQIGKDYSFNYVSRHSSINHDSWYCSELVWASYNYVGIDLSNGFIQGIPPACINNDSDTTTIMKHDSNTMVSCNLFTHSFSCDGQTYIESHRFDGSSGRVCSICGALF